MGRELVNTASVALKVDRYRRRIYGFQLSEITKLQRWHEAVRDRLVLVSGALIPFLGIALRSAGFDGISIDPCREDLGG